jgi:hypothetical protein
MKLQETKLSRSAFGTTHKRSCLGHHPVELSPTEIKTWVLLLKSLQHQLLLELLLLQQVHIAMALEDTAPSDSLLRLLQLDDQLLRMTRLLLLNVPH